MKTELDDPDDLVLLFYPADEIKVTLVHDNPGSVFRWSATYAESLDDKCGSFGKKLVDCTDPSYYMLIKADEGDLDIYCEDVLMYKLEKYNNSCDVMEDHIHKVNFTAEYSHLKFAWAKFLGDTGMTS